MAGCGVRAHRSRHHPRIPTGNVRSHAGLRRADLGVLSEGAPFYAAHLYYAIHFHALVFLVLTLAIPLLLAGGIGPAIARAAPLALLVCHFVGLRRVFGGTRLQTAWKGIVIWIAYTALVLAVMLAIGLRSLREMPADAQPESKGAAVDAPRQEVGTRSRNALTSRCLSVRLPHA
jgi:hypothetical protein